MRWKSILVHLDAAPRCAARVGVAAALAQTHGSHLLGLAATGLPDVLLSMSTAVPDALEVVARSAAELDAAARAQAVAFEQQARAAGVASVEGRIERAEHVDATVRLARSSDLVVIGQTDRGASPLGVGWDFPQQVALHAGGPVLVVPHTGTFATVGAEVLVAWKDVREAARAVRDALPLLVRARRVVVLEIDEGALPGDPPPADTGSLDAVGAWLQRHGVAVETRRAPARGGIGYALLSRATDFGSDVIVMGAYGHSRLREWVLGGATRDLLAHMNVPILLSH